MRSRRSLDAPRNTRRPIVILRVGCLRVPLMSQGATRWDCHPMRAGSSCHHMRRFLAGCNRIGTDSEQLGMMQRIHAVQAHLGGSHEEASARRRRARSRHGRLRGARGIRQDRGVVLLAWRRVLRNGHGLLRLGSQPARVVGRGAGGRRRSHRHAARRGYATYLADRRCVSSVRPGRLPTTPGLPKRPLRRAVSVSNVANRLDLQNRRAITGVDPLFVTCGDGGSDMEHVKDTQWRRLTTDFGAAACLALCCS